MKLKQYFLSAIVLIFLVFFTNSLIGQERISIYDLNTYLYRWIGRTVEITGYLYVDEINDKIEVWQTLPDLMQNNRFNWDKHLELNKGNYLPSDINDIQQALIVVRGTVSQTKYEYAFAGDNLTIALIQVDNFEIKQKNIIKSPYEEDEYGDMPQAACDSCKFAILFNGYRTADFWNDITQKYNYKKNKYKVCPDNIIVLNKGGTQNAGKIPNGTTDGSGNFTSGGAYNCSSANLKKAFDYIKKKMKASNCQPAEFQFHSTGHGGGYHGGYGEAPGNDSLPNGYEGGILDTNHDETQNITNENDVVFKGRGTFDLDRDRKPDIQVRLIPDPRDSTKRIKQVRQDKDGDGTFETIIGADFNGDGRVSKADSSWTAPDLNKNGQIDDVGWDDVMAIKGGDEVSDDLFRKLMQDLLDSTGLDKAHSRAEFGQCFSGSFLDDIRGVTTISTAGAARDLHSRSFRGAHGYNIYEKYFIDSLAAGHSWTDAHKMAADSTKKVLKKWTIKQNPQISDNSNVCIVVKGPYKKGNQICVKIINICGKTVVARPFINTYNWGISASKINKQNWGNVTLKNNETKEFCINLPSDTGKYCFLGGTSYNNDGFKYDAHWLNNIKVEAKIGSNSIPVSFEVGGDKESNVDIVFLTYDPTMLPPGWEIALSQQTVQIIDKEPVQVEAIFTPPPDVSVGDVVHFRIEGWTESPTEPFVGYVEGDIEIVTEMNQLQLDLPEGWSLSSLNGIPDNLLVQDLIPDATIIFGFNQIDGYTPLEIFNPLMGFWANLPQNGEYVYPGTKIDNYSINLPKGWSIIGGISEKLGKVTTENNCNIEAMFGFDVLTGYYETDVIEPGKAVWINLSSDCNVEVNALTNIIEAIKPAPLFEANLKAQGEISGSSISVSNIVLGIDDSDEIAIPAPPPPPDYTTDIRLYQFDNHGKPKTPSLYKLTQVEINKTDTLRWILEIDPNGNDPFTVMKTVLSWESNKFSTVDPYQKWLLVDGIVSSGIGINQIDMKTVNNVEVNGKDSKFFTILSFYDFPNSVENNNLDNEILQIKSIVPNPFNDKVNINFILSKEAEISITIFDIFGREIMHTNQGYFDYGISSIEWNGLNSKGMDVANGTFFVRITAKTSNGIFTEVQALQKIK